MNIIKLAEVLGIDTTCEKQELDKLRIEYGVGMDTAREMIIEPKIYERIKELIKYIQETKQMNEIEELKAKNERLNRCMIETLHHAGQRIIEIIKYKQTLQEIKAIAEKEIYMKQNSSMNRILNLITKAEEE